MEKIQDSDYQKIIKDIEYGKDLLQNRPEQDTVDYKVWEVLDDTITILKKQRKIIQAQQFVLYEACRVLKQKEEEVKLE